MSLATNTNYEALFNFPTTPTTPSPFDADYSTPRDEHQSLDGDQLSNPTGAANSVRTTPTGTRHRSESLEGSYSPALEEPASRHRDKRVCSEMDVWQFVRVAMAGRSLQPSSTADLHAFAKASPEEREVRQHAINLQIRDKLDLLAGAMVSKYQIPDDLATNIAKYSTALIFAPACSAYKICAPKALVAALRRGGVPNLPEDSDQGRISIVTTASTKQLANKRSALKTALVQSLTTYTTAVQNGTFEIATSNIDIGNVTLRLVSGSGIEPTAKHLVRFAWLRFLLHNGVVADNGQFWDNVDKKLQELRSRAMQGNPPNPQGFISRVFQNAFDSDQATFGTAYLGGLTEITSLPAWQKNVEESAAKLTVKD